MSLTTEDPRFPRSSRYNPEWLVENPMGAHPLWLTEWLCQRVELERGMRVLDLGCGKAKSSVFLAREFDVQVWATDLWTSATENQARLVDAGVADNVFPIHADARQLPFAAGFFDAIVCIDAYNYFGTDDLYLNYLAQFLRPGGVFGFVSAGLKRELDGGVPDHLERFWGQDCWTIHSADWWRRHLGRTKLFEELHLEDVEDGARLWLAWAEATNCSDWYQEMLRTDAGRNLGYVGFVGRRIEGVALAEYAWPSTLRASPSAYQPFPIRRPDT